jgi:hypothetical protein
MLLVTYFMYLLNNYLLEELGVLQLDAAGIKVHLISRICRGRILRSVYLVSNIVIEHVAMVVKCDTVEGP